MVKEIPKAIIVEKVVITEESDLARDLYANHRFGNIKRQKVEMSFIEAFYLVEKKKLQIVDSREKNIDFDKLLKKFIRLETDFFVRYKVFADMRDRGYIIKTALKFGAEYRVYDKGVKPGEDHAKWILYPVREADKLTWFEFSSKNRVAHSTKKKLLLGIVDAEGDVTYYEVGWVRP
ncbi:tRNA-intron lyase [Candidatus Woesearchaeota archaeon]|nr:MAG: tRNA-intron lyase [Candidatus Woesearchaeota archaeon]